MHENQDHNHRIKGFIERNRVKEFTVVADAAMISTENVGQLIENNISYIVGARPGNIPAGLLEAIDKKINREEGKSIRIKTDNRTIIERYRELYKIEQAFRVSKSDLRTRPVFHFKEQPIKLHILICFMALVSKHIELRTGVSIRKVPLDESKKTVDGQILNQVTDKVLTVKAEPTKKMGELIAKLFPPH